MKFVSELGLDYTDIALCVVLFAIAWGVFCWLSWWRPHLRRAFLIGCMALAAASIFGIALFTALGRTPSANHRYVFAVYNSHDFLRELSLNTLLYVPLGLSLAELIGWRVIPVGFALSLCIEVWQYTAGTGTAQGTDVLCNTLGCAVGMVPCAIARLMSRPWSGRGTDDSWLNRDALMKMNWLEPQRPGSVQKTLLCEVGITMLVSCVLTTLGISDVQPYPIATLWFVVLTIVVVQIGRAFNGGRALFCIYMCSYAAKLIVALVRLSQNSIYGLLSGKDAYRFWWSGVDYYHGVQSQPNRIYSRLLCAEFHVFGANYLCAMLVNIVLSMLAVAMVYEVLMLLGIKKPAMLVGVTLAGLMPYNVLSASELLREPLYLFLIAFSQLVFVRTTRRGLSWLASLAALPMLPVMVLHGGYFPVAMVYVCTAIVLTIQAQEKDAPRRLLVPALLICGCAVVMVLLDSHRVLHGIVNPDDLLHRISEMNRSETATGAGSAYLLDLHADSWLEVFLYLPLEFLYFWLSPMPTNWRGMSDIVTFCLDSTVHLGCFALLVACIGRAEMRKVARQRKSLHVLLVCLAILVLCGVVFAYGTYTAGTAIRHRDVLVSIEAVAIATCWELLRPRVGCQDGVSRAA